VRCRFTIVTVGGVSMAPTLSPGDRVLIVKRRGSSIRRGDVVAARLPDSAARTWSDETRFGTDAPVPDWVIKRVAAVAGEIAPNHDGITNVVPEDQLYLLGDGVRSMDSRHWGAISSRDVLGVVIARLPRSPA
jgi:signal peptidase I